MNQRHGQHRRIEAPSREELAEDDLQIGHRRREQQLDGAGALLFRVGPHRDERHHEQDQDRVFWKSRPDHLLVDVHGWAPPNWLICMLWRTK